MGIIDGNITRFYRVEMLGTGCKSKLLKHNAIREMLENSCAAIHTAIFKVQGELLIGHDPPVFDRIPCIGIL